ncbi:MAG: hypothetical protein EP311_00145 [Cytophagales bacterium]|nr:MAG: hypothetical protein EP311_00145 [Cytophagales bacterium]
MKKQVFIFIISALLFTCQEKEEPQILGEEEIFWVYSHSLPCPPDFGTESPCLLITKKQDFDYSILGDEVIPDQIEGFTFKPYFIQKLKVLKLKDVKSGEMTRKLVEILEEKKDYLELLEGGWKVKRYNGEDLPNPSFPNGQTVGISSFIRIAYSTDGCNNITLQIKEVGPNKILSVGFMTSTLKACHGEQQIIPFPWTRNFKREGNILTFSNEEGEEVAIWEKLN